MMSLSTKTKLGIQAVVCIAGVLTVIAIAYTMMARYQVTGPLYRQIVDGKDVIADVLPPPLFIVESYLVALRLDNEADPAKREGMRKRLALLRDQFNERHTFWRSRDMDVAALKTELLGAPIDTAMDFFAVLDERYLPAIATSDPDKIAAATVALESVYLKHQGSNTVLVDLATGLVARDEQEGKTASSRAILLIAIIGGVVAVLVIITSTYGVISINGPLLRIQSGLATGAAHCTGRRARSSKVLPRRCCAPTCSHHSE